MDSLSPHETLTPDPLLTLNSDPVPETLAQTEGNAAGNTLFTAGMFVWAKVRRRPWWPALVSSQLKKDSVLVACFGSEETLAWCEPKQLKPFFSAFDEMLRQSSSKSFLTALHSCVQEVERSLELGLTCSCVPAEARSNPLRGEDGGEVPVANFSPKEFRERIMVVSRNVQAVSVLEAARLRSWVFGFGKVSMQGDSWAFCRRRGIDDLVDKIDLDALPVEMVGAKDEVEEGLVIDSSIGKRRRRSVSKLIAEMDLDLVDLDDDDDDEEDDDDKEEVSLRSMKRRGRGKLEAVKAEEEAGSSSGRRERKKSKYLSPPYTNLREVGKFLAMLPRKNSSSSDHGVTTGPSACQDEEEDDDENKSSLLKIQRMPTIELLSELLSTAENPLHLKGNRAAKVIRFFLAMYRDSKYSDGAGFEDYQKSAHESTAKTGDIVEDSRKHELTGRIRKDLEVKRQKTNNKPGADPESKLDSVPPKRNHRNGDDLDSKPQRNSGLEKQKPTRKKLLKDRTSQGAPIFLDFCNANSLDAGEGKKRKKSGNIMDGSRQGAQVDSDLNLSNASLHGKEKQKLSRRKKLNDAASKEIPANLDLNMVDSSGEYKLEQCNKRSKSNADDDSAMVVGPQFVGDSEDVGGLDIEPINCQKLVLVDEKKVGSKEDANGKAFQKLVCADARFSELGRSILKKKNASSQPKAKSGRRKVKGVDHPGFPREAALHLTFHPGVTLPSAEDLVATYSKYGDLIRNQPVELFEESNSARVLFAKDADAESAFKDEAGPFGSVATRRLHLSRTTTDHGQSNHETVSSLLQIPNAISPVKSEEAKPALPYIRKSLETMISTLAWSSSSPVNSAGPTSDGLKPEARENLVGEMQGLLQKVEKMLNGAGSSS